MDLSTIITSKIYNVSDTGPSQYALEGVTKLTGYEWKTYAPSLDLYQGVLSRLYESMNSWIGILMIVLFTIIIGEVIFYFMIKNYKVDYKRSINEFVLGRKFISYILGLLIVEGGPACIFIVGLLLSLLLLNLHLLIVLVLGCGLWAFGLIMGLALILKVLVWGNKKLFGHLIQQETKEEYEEQQNKYKFRDGTIVKFKPEVATANEIEGYHITEGAQRRCKDNEVFEIEAHRGSKKQNIILRTSKHESQPLRKECLMELATEEEINKFRKEKVEYEESEKLLQEKRKNNLLSKFYDWLFTL
jgi:hypothetical protein